MGQIEAYIERAVSDSSNYMIERQLLSVNSKPGLTLVWNNLSFAEYLRKAGYDAAMAGEMYGRRFDTVILLSAKKRHIKHLHTMRNHLIDSGLLCVQVFDKADDFDKAIIDRGFKYLTATMDMIFYVRH